MPLSCRRVLGGGKTARAQDRRTKMKTFQRFRSSIRFAYSITSSPHRSRACGPHRFYKVIIRIVLTVVLTTLLVNIGLETFPLPSRRRSTVILFEKLWKHFPEETQASTRHI